MNRGLHVHVAHCKNLKVEFLVGVISLTINRLTVDGAAESEKNSHQGSMRNNSLHRTYLGLFSGVRSQTFRLVEIVRTGFGAGDRQWKNPFGSYRYDIVLILEDPLDHQKLFRNEQDAMLVQQVRHHNGIRNSGFIFQAQK